ncbi:MAG: hypothetical protein K2X04_09700 [Burkholderiales bacterium]|nr:hypothetical protein [Burkholderiales bacterium]
MTPKLNKFAVINKIKSDYNFSQLQTFRIICYNTYASLISATLWNIAKAWKTSRNNQSIKPEQLIHYSKQFMMAVLQWNNIRSAQLLQKLNFNAEKIVNLSHTKTELQLWIYQHNA